MRASVRSLGEHRTARAGRQFGVKPCPSGIAAETEGRALRDADACCNTKRVAHPRPGPAADAHQLLGAAPVEVREETTCGMEEGPPPSRSNGAVSELRTRRTGGRRHQTARGAARNSTSPTTLGVNRGACRPWCPTHRNSRRPSTRDEQGFARCLAAAYAAVADTLG